MPNVTTSQRLNGVDEGEEARKLARAHACETGDEEAAHTVGTHLPHRDLPVRGVREQSGVCHRYRPAGQPTVPPERASLPVPHRNSGQRSAERQQLVGCTTVLAPCKPPVH